MLKSRIIKRIRSIFSYLRKKYIYVLTFVIIFFYAIIQYFLKYKGVIKTESLINNITSFVGWLVALGIALIHLHKNRLDNLILNKRETKQRLEIQAFREINDAISKFSNTMGSVSVGYWTWPGKLRLHIKNPSVFSFDKNELDLKISEQIIKMGYAEANFVIAIEAKEIIIIKFDHLRMFIHLRVEDIEESIERFRSYLFDVDEKYLTTSEGCTYFQKRCEEINEQFVEINGYLYDYRIELMNSLLGDIFDVKVPVRSPKDSRYKILTEIAEKEDVEREVEERQMKLMEQKDYL